MSSKVSRRKKIESNEQEIRIIDTTPNTYNFSGVMRNFVTIWWGKVIAYGNRDGGSEEDRPHQHSFQKR